ncbi:hypothetical protein ACFWSO_36280, partial [Streptomyces sp. NPDC058572]
RAYVTDNGASSVSVIDTLTNTVLPDTVTVGTDPWGVAVGAVPGTATATCTTGSLTGGGVEITGPFPSNFTNRPVTGNTWETSATNPTTRTNTLTPQAACGTA